MFAVKVLSLLLLVVVSTEALRCIQCQPKTCVDPTGCKGGLVPDVCNCCRRCAKVLNEDCGGPWGLSGTCDQGLTCKVSVNDGGLTVDPSGVGKCKPKKTES